MPLAPEFYSGDMAHCVVTVNGSTFELPARSWNLTIDGKIKDVSNTRDGRYRIGGLVDATGTVEMPLDGAIYTPRPKDVVTLKLYSDYGNLKFYGLAAIITSQDPNVNLEGEFMVRLPFSLSSGTVTYPTYP
jgi:hypothetical protein